MTFRTKIWGLPAGACAVFVIGKSDEHLAYPGTLSLAAGTAGAQVLPVPALDGRVIDRTGTFADAGLPQGATKLVAARGPRDPSGAAPDRPQTVPAGFGIGFTNRRQAQLAGRPVVDRSAASRVPCAA